MDERMVEIVWIRKDGTVVVNYKNGTGEVVPIEGVYRDKEVVFTELDKEG